jgi:Spin-doc zinc-finger
VCLCAINSGVQKRKVDNENRTFYSSWTYEFCFVLPARANSKPMCLVCHDTVAVVKSSNLKRHYESKHKGFETNNPKNSNNRNRKIDDMVASFNRSTNVLTTSIQN